MKHTLSILKACSDRNRLRALGALVEHRELCACQITELLKVAGATVSRHMGLLIIAGLVESRKDGRWVYYKLRKSADKQFIKWLKNKLENSADFAKDLKTMKKILKKNPEDICRKQRGSKLKVLFLCTGNSCRSQMAEGWAKNLKSNVIDAYSAGIETHGLNPYAVKVMSEAGVDISKHKSQHIDEFYDIDLDYVVTVCGHADENCPVFPAKCKIVHIGFDDPPKMAKEFEDEEKKLNCYREVRDKIKAFIQMLPKGVER